MMDGYRCGDTETLVAYLYSEIDAEERRRFEAHLKACPACTTEVEALSDVRQELLAWLPPEPELGFTIVRKPAEVLRPGRWWSRPLPVWGQAAAAVLVLAGGAAIANVQVRYDESGFQASTGWMATPSSAPAPSARSEDASRVGATAVALASTSPETRQSLVSAEEWRTALTSLESEMRRQMQSLRMASGHAPGGPAQSSDGAVLKRVQNLIEESEQRQQRELALRLTQLGRDVELQRRTDLVRIEQGFGQFEGRTGAEVARQRQLIDYLVRTSGRQVVP